MESFILKMPMDRLDFQNEMDSLDLKMSILAELCITINPTASLPGESISEIGGLIFDYLVNKQKLENRFWRKND